MHLDVTPDLVQDLHDYARRTGRPADTCIYLGADGWQLAVRTGTTYHEGALVALTAEDVDTWLDGAEELDEDTAAALAAPSDGTSYLIPDEHGRHLDPGQQAQPQVVTHVATYDPDPDDVGRLRYDTESSLEDSYWIDQATAGEVVAEPRHTETADVVTSLWVTAGGRWLLRSRSHWGGTHHWWAEIPVELAAHYMYNAVPDLLVGDDTMGEGLVAGARAARQVADAVTLPHVPLVDGRRHHPQRVLDAALAAEETSRALGTLLRTVTVPDLRRCRADAAQILVDGLGRQEARRLLGVSESTLRGLVGQDAS